jgi:2-(3-amino-3-carboxypropyl)histidine synthase
VDINAAIAHLPRNYNFEIHKTIQRIRTSGATNIALQFPEGLLLFAPLISDILTQFCPGTDTLIMGDVTYGACCIDDYTARALGCDLLVHYGHSCLVPVDSTGGIKTLYVFVTIGIDVEHLIATVERNFQSGKRIALVGTIQFNSTLHAIVPRLRAMGYDPILPRSAPLSAGEILGCTAPTLTASSLGHSKSEKTIAISSSANTSATDADMILYVGDGRFHLESILIASPTLRAHTYRYDPYSRRLTHETYEHEEMHSLRRSAIRAARATLTLSRTSLPGPPPPRIWALILGTLGRQGNPHTLELIKSHLTQRGVPWITLLLSEVTPQKLALMSQDIGVWVQIACPRLSIDWGYAFERPLLSPYEACVALDIKEGAGWGAAKNENVAEAASKEMAEITEDLAKIALEQDIGLYPMDFYAKEGLGRTRADEVPIFEEIEVT